MQRVDNFKIRALIQTAELYMVNKLSFWLGFKFLTRDTKQSVNYFYVAVLKD